MQAGLLSLFLDSGDESDLGSLGAAPRSRVLPPGGSGKFIPQGVKLDHWETGSGGEVRWLLCLHSSFVSSLCHLCTRSIRCIYKHPAKQSVGCISWQCCGQYGAHFLDSPHFLPPFPSPLTLATLGLQSPEKTSACKLYVRLTSHVFFPRQSRWRHRH